MVDPILTPAELAEVQAYHAAHYVYAGVGNFLSLGLALFTMRCLVRPLWSAALRAAAALGRRFGALRTLPGTRAVFRALDAMWSGPGWSTALLFCCFYFFWETLIGLPEGIYFGYVHEHRFGLSRYTPGQFALDSLKSVAISVFFLSLLAFGLFGLVRKLEDRWWLVLGSVGAALLLISAGLDPYRSRLYFEQQPLPAGPLREQITGLMAKAGIDFRDVLVEKTSRATVKVQAYFAGRGPTRTIVVNDQLLASMKEDEVLAAIAHEAGHVHEPRWPGHLASSAALVGFLYLVHRLLRWVHRRGWFGVTEVADIRALPLIITVFWTLFTAIRPVTAALSRQRELDADRYAVALTRDPEAFQRMLKVACRVNKMDPEPPRWVVLRGSSHPPIRQRLEAVDAPAPR